jgi:hypothetical protein
MTYTPPYHTECCDIYGYYPCIDIRDAKNKLIRCLSLNDVRAILAVRGELEDFAGRHEG